MLRPERVDPRERIVPLETGSGVYSLDSSADRFGLRLTF